MSAETLRRAATLMRESWSEAADVAARMRADGSGVAVGTLAPTMLAVADWLGNAAAIMDGDPAGLAEVRQSHALAVANAYLGNA